jgi:hypothetical protein
MRSGSGSLSAMRSSISGVAQRLWVKIVTSMVDAARAAATISTCSVAFHLECRLLPFDASRIFEKRCVREVEENQGLDEILPHPQAWHPATVRDGEDHRWIDGRSARFHAAGPPGNDLGGIGTCGSADRKSVV